MGRSLFDKIWDAHVVSDLGDGWALLHVDRQLMHDLGGGPTFAELARRGLALRNPELDFAVPDHAVSSQPGRVAATYPLGGKLYAELRNGAQQAGVRFFELGKPGQGIVHVMGPELGLVLPGLTVICTDSHTCTNGGLGALAFGVGSSESAHALATQTLRLRKPKRMRITCDGALLAGVTAKDLALHIVATLGADGGVGYAVEYAGSAIAALEIEERLTVCNLSVERGARFALIAPDASTFSYLRGRVYVPEGDAFDAAVRDWEQLTSDADAVYDREVCIDASSVVPTVSWGISPDQSIRIDAHIPDPAEAEGSRREAQAAALAYMGLGAGDPIAGTSIDWVFIGSCANSRLSDLRAAAQIARGRHVASGVTAWVVPGSETVKRQAEAEGLRAVFEAAGFQWREPGCSLCVAANGEQVPPGARCFSTSNRNFVGRQGPQARTHLGSPAMAAAAAIKGCITDVRILSQ
jgi:3-isopropylmalate/(R)-2-methylmalate dehydratase large subunit